MPPAFRGGMVIFLMSPCVEYTSWKELSSELNCHHLCPRDISCAYPVTISICPMDCWHSLKEGLGRATEPSPESLISLSSHLSVILPKFYVALRTKGGARAYRLEKTKGKGVLLCDYREAIIYAAALGSPAFLS